jgi:tetratricopeptide (TPR) repeat protein
MASLIPGYEYDIFISYRQKDNKGDRWVSEFVDQLKGELESTFKEEISVYFDLNPHDGLLETHDVDASLKDKLKCLIFIPILSRTYCDPKSFAWEHEFRAFVDLVSKDPLGLKVRLSNGNLANRVLPVRIHDLETEDIKLFEGVTGSVMRTLDFVFKTAAGVNRPLKSNEDHPGENLNKTYYRDQINKFALAIKEIVQGMKTEPALPVKEKTDQKKPLEETRKEERMKESKIPSKSSYQKLLIGSIVFAVLLIIAAIFAFPQLFRRDKLEKLRSSGGRISVAVMPFQNMTNDTIWNVWQDGIKDILITSLSNSEELIVRQTESVTSLIKSKGLANYASITPSVAKAISKKLDANVFIQGNIKQAGNRIRFYAQLFDSETEEVYKSFQIETSAKEEMIFSIIDSLSGMVRNFLILSELKRDLPINYKDYISTDSPEAFRYFIYGRNAFNAYDYPTARNWLSQAISVDSNYIDAILLLSIAYGNQFVYDQITKSYGNEFYYDQAKKWCVKAYEKKEQMPMQQKIHANQIYAYLFETPLEEIRYLKQLLDFDDQNPGVYFSLGNCYMNLCQYENAIPDYEKALAIYKKWGVKPERIFDYVYLGESFEKIGKFKETEKLFKKAEKDFPDDPYLILNQALLSLIVGDTIAANEYIEKGIFFMKSISMSEASIAAILAFCYSTLKSMDKAEEYYRQALSLEPENPFRLNDLAYFLIYNDRDVHQGMESIERALKVRPDYYIYLHTKGWGLYKQGKYQEALEYLQKSWDLRRQNAIYDHEAFLHLEEAKKAVAKNK